MLQTKKIIYNSEEFTKIFSDENFYIQNELGILFTEVYKTPNSTSTYTETNIKIKS